MGFRKIRKANGKIGSLLAENGEIYDSVPECEKCKSNENVKDQRNLGQRGSLILKQYYCSNCKEYFWILLGDISRKESVPMEEIEE
jgi:hypothetical protein